MPEFIPPSNWLPRVWNRVEADGSADQERQQDDGFAFESAHEA
jgi:hypothetical protein